jgi:hypothetical protein
MTIRGDDPAWLLPAGFWLEPGVKRFKNDRRPRRRLTINEELPPDRVQLDTRPLTADQKQH